MPETSDAAPRDWNDLRERILSAAAALIAAGGRDAATTRAVASAAGVQAPTIYRLFGDKRGLLDAVAAHQMSAYVAEKTKRAPHPDPLQELRDGWDMHVAFGLAHPGLFAILSSDVRQGPPSPTMAEGAAVLRRRIRTIASAGRLKVGEDRAVALLQAMGTGTVLTLLGEAPEHRDPGLSIAAREAVMAAISDEPRNEGDHRPAGAAATLRALLDSVTVLSSGERHLLEELLDRIANGTGGAS